MTQIIVRQATVEDAAQTVALTRSAMGEPGNYLITAAHEFSFSTEDERRFILDHNMSRNSVFLVAEAQTTPAQIVGTLSCRGGNRESTRHVAKLGITVARGWRDKGVGSLLIEGAIRWARGTGIIKRIELSVMSPNSRAIHVYEKFGFVLEGRQQAAYFKEGKYLDNLLMALILDESLL